MAPLACCRAEDAKRLVGVGQANNRKTRAVERTVPFGLVCLTLTVCWYVTAGHNDDVTEHRASRPWYRTQEQQPSTADMLAELRRALALIAARFRPVHPEQPTAAEIQTIHLAWEDPAAVTAKLEGSREPGRFR